MKVLITGAGGLIGKRVVAALEQDGHVVVRLARQRARPNEISWRPGHAIDPAAFAGADAVIHLAGENIAERWTDAKKKRIYDSRVLGTRTLAEAMARAHTPPKVLLSASAIGIYGDRGDEVLSEDSSLGNDFLAGVARDWENATNVAADAGIRTVLLRFGVVLAREGGALPQMAAVFRRGLGGRVGSGRQWTSWVAIEDVVGVVEFALTRPELHGPVNAVAPNPVTNAGFTRTLARVLRRPAVLPLPAFAVRAIFGEMGESLLLSSARVRPRRLEKRGFLFRYPELESALRRLLRRTD